MNKKKKKFLLTKKNDFKLKMLLKKINEDIARLDSLISKCTIK